MAQHLCREEVIGIHRNCRSPENMYIAARKERSSKGLGTLGGSGAGEQGGCESIENWPQPDGQGGRGEVEGEANKGEERKSRREGTPANKDRLFQVIWRVTLFSSSPKKDGLSAWGSVLFLLLVGFLETIALEGNCLEAIVSPGFQWQRCRSDRDQSQFRSSWELTLGLEKDVKWLSFLWACCPYYLAWARNL